MIADNEMKQQKENISLNVSSIHRGNKVVLKEKNCRNQLFTRESTNKESSSIGDSTQSKKNDVACFASVPGDQEPLPQEDNFEENSQSDVIQKTITEEYSKEVTLLKAPSIAQSERITIQHATQEDSSKSKLQTSRSTTTEEKKSFTGLLIDCSLAAIGKTLKSPQQVLQMLPKTTSKENIKVIHLIYT